MQPLTGIIMRTVNSRMGDNKNNTEEILPSENYRNIIQTPAPTKPVIHSSDSPIRDNIFRPPNFPLSPAFSPSTNVFKPLPGIVSERPTSYDTTEQIHEELENLEDEENDSCDVNDDSGPSLFQYLMAFLAVCLSVAVAIYLTLPGKEGATVSNISKIVFQIDAEVNSKVIGQSQAVASLLGTLINMTEESNNVGFCHVLLLTGGPGVGKDYLSQVVRDHFYSVAGEECKENSFLRLSPKYFNTDQYCLRQDFNLYTFETVYSMESSQIEKATETLGAFTKFCKEHKKKAAVMVPVLVVKAHSIPSLGIRGVDSFESRYKLLKFIESEGHKVKEALSGAGIQSDVVLFSPLSLDDVKLCILKSAQLQGRATPNPQAVEEILSLLLGSTGGITDFVQVGCKDVDAMVALLPYEA